MKNLIKLLSIIAILLAFAIGCEKEEDNAPKKDNDTIDTLINDTLIDDTIKNTSTIIDTIVLIDASNNAWKYYSFEKGDTVKISDPANSLDWDIAFFRNKVKSNSGKSGIGKAGSFKTKLLKQSGYDALVIVPDTAVFTTDDSTNVYGYNPANPTVPTVSKEILNGPLYDWYNLQQGAASTLAPKDNIYIVKTAKEKYAKLWIKSYYRNTDGKSGFFTIAYTYQKNGSKNLK